MKLNTSSTTLKTCLLWSAIFTVVFFSLAILVEITPDPVSEALCIPVFIVAFPSVLLFLVLAVLLQIVFFWPDSVSNLVTLLFMFVPSLLFW